MKRTSPPSIKHFPAAKQRRLDQLLDKNSEGTITPREKERLELLVAEAEKLMIANAKRLVRFTRSQKRGASKKAIPVTVWVQPAKVGR